MLNAGSQLEVSSGNFDDRYPLPMANFRYLGPFAANEGYRYRDRDLSDGPVKAVTIKGGRLVKIVAKGGALGHTLASNPAPVDVVLRLAGRSYALRFGGTVRFDAGKRYRAKDAPPPAPCP